MFGEDVVHISQLYKPNMEIECVGHDDDDWLQHKRRAFRTPFEFGSGQLPLVQACPFFLLFPRNLSVRVYPLLCLLHVLSEQEVYYLLDEYGMQMC